MTATQQITEEAYQRLVFNDPNRNWELHDGRLVEKPGMSWDHGDVATFLSHLLQLQLDRREFRVAVNDWRVRPAPGSIYIPDIVVIPTAFGEEFRGRPGVLAIFPDPLPLVIEIWSHSTGDYDVEAKIPEYRRRGDHEIWRVHPYERTLTGWRRQPDGAYAESVYREGLVHPVALPGVAIDLGELFDEG